MRQAAKSPGLAPENIAFVDALLGNLLVYSGDPAGGRRRLPRRPRARARAMRRRSPGRAAWRSAPGNLDEAIALFQRAADIVPLPEYVIALGDAQTAAGRTDDAARNFKLARAEIQLFQATGVVVDLDLALFEADHGDPSAGAGARRGRLQGDADRPRRRRPGLGAPPAGPRRRGERSARDEALRLGSHRPAAPVSRRARSRRPSAMPRALGGTSSWRSRPTRASRRPGPPRHAGSWPRCRTDRAATAPFIRSGRSLRTNDDSTRTLVATRPSCTADQGGPGGTGGPARPIGGEITLSTRSRPPASPARCSSRRRRSAASSRPATGRRRSSRAIPPRTTRTCTRSSARTIPNSLTIIANYVPLEEPAGGPNFFPFDPTVRYEIHIDNNGDGKADINYDFRFKTQPQGDELRRHPDVPLQRRADHQPDRPEPARSADLRRRSGTASGSPSDVPTPPANIGPRSTPDYAALAASAVKTLGNGTKLFAGQRDDAFFVDLGSIFDLAGLRRSTPSMPSRCRPRRASTASAASTPTRSPSRSRSSS